MAKFSTTDFLVRAVAQKKISLKHVFAKHEVERTCEVGLSSTD